MAKDKDGRLGPWHYVEFTPTEGVNITPAYDFWSNPESAPGKVVESPAEDGIAGLPVLSLKSKAPAQSRLPGKEQIKVEKEAQSSLGRN